MDILDILITEFKKKIKITVIYKVIIIQQYGIT